MTTKLIEDKLRKKFKSHKYEIANSYIYKWESDFFSITPSGYAQEIEVKLSLSDFRADFKKRDKHNAIESRFKGKRFYIKKLGNWVTITYEEKKFKLVDGNRVWNEDTSSWEYEGNGKWHTKETFEKYLDYFKKNYLNISYEPHSCKFEITSVGIVPNKFWYICPTGVIPVDEVPDYAGLYYISDNHRIKVIKNAPFIHRDQEDLTQILLDKFYWKAKNLLEK